MAAYVVHTVPSTPSDDSDESVPSTHTCSEERASCAAQWPGSPGSGDDEEAPSTATEIHEFSPGVRSEVSEIFGANTLTWYENQRNNVYRRCASKAVSSDDLAYIQALVSTHGGHLLLCHSDGQVGPQLSLHASAVTLGHHRIASFIRETVTEMLILGLQDFILNPPADRAPLMSAPVQKIVQTHLEAGAHLGTAPESTGSCMPLHAVCSGVPGLSCSDSSCAVRCAVTALINEAPHTLFCSVPQLPLELAVANPEFADVLVPPLCAAMGGIVLKHPSVALSKRVRRAAQAACARVPSDECALQFLSLLNAFPPPSLSEVERPAAAVAFETWHMRSQRLRIMEQLVGGMEIQDVAKEATARIAELEEMFEGQQRAHEQRVAELMRALDKAQRAADRVAELEALLEGQQRAHEERVAELLRALDEAQNAADRGTTGTLRSTKEQDRQAYRDNTMVQSLGQVRTKPEPVSIASNMQFDSVGRNEALILAIRKHRGLDLDLDGASLPPALVESAAAMQQSLGAAVERLASDLYTSRGHFMYELLQNADDNKYGEGVKPSIKFALSESQQGSYFVSVNNELGMDEKDVRALCDVNRSMKREGQIGRKGVGWKSVFAVSDSPVILSGSFRFKFDVACHGRLGYVTPEVVSDADFAEVPAQWQNAYQGRPSATVLYLPITQRDSSSIRQAIHATGGRLFEDPSWLLFLRQVRQVEWENLSTVPSQKVRAERLHSSENNVILVQHNRGEEEKCEEMKYLVHRKVVSVPTKLQCKGWSPEEEVSVAVRATGSASADGDSAEQSLDGVMPPVFCFLPVRPVGFRFLLHAPWVLTSNREDWHFEDERNLWLRDTAATALAETITHFGHALGDRCLDLLDGRRVLDPFWRKLLEQAALQLGDATIVPVESEREVPDSQLLAKPSQVLVPSPALVRSTKVLVFLSMLPVKVWLPHTGKYLAKISNNLSSAAEETQRLLTLGAEPLSLARLSQILNNAEEIDEVLSQPRALNALYDVLAHFTTPQSQANTHVGSTLAGACLIDKLQEIQQMRAFPLDWKVSGKRVHFARLSEGDVFLPASSEEWCPGLDSHTCQMLLFHKGIRVLSREMLQALPAEGRTFIEKMMFTEATLENVAAAVVRTHALHLADAPRILTLKQFTQIADNSLASAVALQVIWAGIETVIAAHLTEHGNGKTTRTPAQFLSPGRNHLQSPVLKSVLWLPCHGSDGNVVLRRSSQTSLPSMLGVSVEKNKPLDLPVPMSSLLPGIDAQTLLSLASESSPQELYLVLCLPFEMTKDPACFHKVLRWEAFLANLGSTFPSFESINGSELASQIVSKSLWESLAKSAMTRKYALNIFQACGSWISELEVPPRFAGHSTHRVHAHFSRSAFEPLVGDGFLPFVDAADVCTPLLEALRIPASLNVASLVRAWKSWATRSPPPAHAPIGLLTALQAALDQEEIFPRSLLQEMRNLIFIPGRGTIPTEHVVWSEGDDFGNKLCEFTKITVLSTTYTANLKRLFCAWLGVSELPDVRHFLQALEIIAAPDEGRRPRAPLQFLRQVYEHIAAMTERWFRDEMGDSPPPTKRARNALRPEDSDQSLGLQKVASLRAIFEQRRLIILPQAKGKPWKFLAPSEAFWSVDGDIADLPCSHWALCNVYARGGGLDLRPLFVEHLLVPPVLSRASLLQRVRSSTSARNPQTSAGDASSDSSDESDDDAANPRDDTSLFLSDLIGGDDSFLGEAWTPARERSSRPAEAGNQDPEGDEAAMRVLVSRCAQRTRSAHPGEIFYSAAVPSRARNIRTAREEEMALKRTSWTCRGTHLYAIGTAAQLASRSELRTYGLEMRGAQPGLSESIVVSSNLSQRAEAFARSIISPLSRVFDLPPGQLCIAVGPGMGRSGKNVKGLVCLPVPEGRVQAQEERFRWFSEVCGLLAENGNGEGFTGREITAAMVAHFLPRLWASESRQ